MNKLLRKIFNRRFRILCQDIIYKFLLSIDSGSLYQLWGNINIILRYKKNIQEYEKYFVFDHNAIWSAPRSGNHWIRFIAEYLTGCPTHGCGSPSDTPIYLRPISSEEHPLAHIDPSKPPILYKSHQYYTMTSQSTILLLIRDYREYLCWGKEKSQKLLDAIMVYLNLMVKYDCFDGTKMLIYYEDLVTCPEREISRIKDFLGASDERYKAFMNRYEYYSQLSMQVSSAYWRSCKSNSDFRFYQKQIDEQEMLRRKKLFHTILAAKRYRCVKPYLARYE